MRQIQVHEKAEREGVIPNQALPQDILDFIPMARLEGRVAQVLDGWRDLRGYCTADRNVIEMETKVKSG